ncbi:MAG TPA: type II secretion system protein [Thermoanaerobaculia bacterium]|jgi:prepilin-type N-terminal cleavage/methylation domain-containing protein|nr:type II secretion system protein [Thermoanaerobaculia bacterium]
MSDARGFQLVEMVVALAVLAIGALLVVPPVLSLSAALRVDLAAHELAAALQEAKSLARRHSAMVAVKFYPGANRVAFACYRDGDGDGVLNSDIVRGVDPQVTPLRFLAHLGGRVGFGFPPGPPPRDPGDPSRRLGRLADPVRFNDSDLASFGSFGSATPGSLYVTDGRRELAVVRVTGISGRVRILHWNPDADSWK